MCCRIHHLWLQFSVLQTKRDGWAIVRAGVHVSNSEADDATTTTSSRANRHQWSIYWRRSGPYLTIHSRHGIARAYDTNVDILNGSQWYIILRVKIGRMNAYWKTKHVPIPPEAKRSLFVRRNFTTAGCMSLFYAAFALSFPSRRFFCTLFHVWTWLQKDFGAYAVRSIVESRVFLRDALPW